MTVVQKKKSCHTKRSGRSPPIVARCQQLPGSATLLVRFGHVLATVFRV